MTSDKAASGDENQEDEDLDLDKLFQSIPTQQSDDDPETSVEGSEVDQYESMDQDLDADDSDPEVETPKETGRRGHFDEFLKRIDSSQKEPEMEDSTEGRQNIQDLLSRMEGGASASAGEETATDTPPTEADTSSRTLDLDEREAGSGPEQASTGPADSESDLGGFSDASNLLFKASRSGGTDPDVCNPFFSAHLPEAQNVLLVSLRQSSEDRMDAFYAGSPETPENLAVITSNDAVRSTTTAKGTDGEAGGSNITVKVVSDPGDLTRLGITISNVLSAWQGNGNQTLVCFDSLSSLLQYADLQRVFRFIHVLQGRLGNVDAMTHYHLDPEAHDSQTEATMRSLFDGIISVSDSGELEYE